ncbi:MAG: hypothetical protein QOD06_1589 [Candidatus Binatota bacterium]|nr:hypothetical protein [Candidatus Binatota bacterium]
MDASLTEIGPDLFRISIFAPDFRIQFNSFLLRDDEPFLMHTGLRKLFPQTREAIARVIDPATLRWIGYSHFEPDECGALNSFLGIAPEAQAVAGLIGSLVMLGDYADRAPRMLADGEVIETGRHRLRFLETPHVPHCWDAGLFFDETDRTLFCSDLFFHPGDPEPATEDDIVGRAREAILGSRGTAFGKDMPYTPYTDATFARLAELEPRMLAVMHGSAFRGDGGRALRDLAQVVRETHGRAA